MFIVFEGLDGSGSTTQSKMLKENLESLGKKVVQTKEPTVRPIGKLIRQYLQHEYETDPKAFQLLFAADRADHLWGVIKPALADKALVISDRYMYSSIAYGAASAKVSYEWLKDLYKDYLKESIVFLLKVPAKECIARISKREGQSELFEKEEYLEKVWSYYERLAAENDNFYIIDAFSKDKFATAEEILEIVKQKI
jgi:dTMP kinase